MTRRPSKPLARHALLLATATIIAAGAGCKPNASAENASRPIAVGETVPELTVRTLSGDSARVAAGEPVTLVNVWATWCGPCEKEFPEIEALQREFGPRGLRIVAISVDEGDDAVVRDFVARQGATFEIGRDPEGAVRSLYQGIGVPETYLISADGRLLARQFGAIPEGAAAMRAAIDRALGSPPQTSTSREFRRASA